MEENPFFNFLSAGGKQHAEGFCQRENITERSLGPAAPADQSQRRAGSATAKQRGGTLKHIYKT